MMLSVFLYGWQILFTMLLTAFGAFYENMLATLIPFLFIFLPMAIPATFVPDALGGLTGRSCMIANTTLYYKPGAPGYGTALSSGSLAGDGSWTLIVGANQAFTIIGQLICVVLLYQYKVRPKEERRQAEKMISLTKGVDHVFYDLATALGLDPFGEAMVVDETWVRRLSSETVGSWQTADSVVAREKEDRDEKMESLLDP